MDHDGLKKVFDKIRRNKANMITSAASFNSIKTQFQVQEPSHDSCFTPVKHDYLRDVCDLLDNFSEPIINFRPTGPAEYLAKPFKILDGSNVIPSWC